MSKAIEHERSSEVTRLIQIPSAEWGVRNYLNSRRFHPHESRPPPPFSWPHHLAHRDEFACSHSSSLRHREGLMVFIQSVNVFQCSILQCMMLGALVPG